MKKLWKEHPEKFKTPNMHVLAPYGFKGKHHIEEAKRKISEQNSRLFLGSGNPNFGKVWIYNEQLDKKMMVKKECVDDYLNSGWILGAAKPRIQKIDESKPAHLRCWINNGRESKFILKTEVDIYISQGWCKGRLACNV